MDKEQRSELQRRVVQAIKDKERSASVFSVSLATAPIEIRAARRTQKRAEKVVERYKTKVATANRKFNVRVNEAAYHVREVILFGDPVKALKAVKEFERRQFK